jgi:hypothetical protein
MKKKPTPICSKHNIPKQWQPVTFEYGDEGISIRVPNVYVWVCPIDDSETSFTPETADELIATVRELAETAKRARARRSALTEYIVSVG